MSVALKFTDKIEDNHRLSDMMQEAYDKSISVNQAFWAEADMDARFKAGDDSIFGELYGQLPAFRRKLFSFNRIRRICNLITGHQRRTRKSMSVIPIENADNVTADQFTKVLMWCVNRDNMLHTISDAFEGAVTSGMNLLSLWVDFQNDAINGNLRLSNVSYNGYMIDPFFKNADLSDCNFVWTRKWLTKEQIKSLLPFRKKEVDDLPYGDTGDVRFNFMPESMLWGIENNFLTYDEFFYRDVRKQNLLVDMRSGQTLEWRGASEDLEFFLNTHEEIKLVKNRIPTVKMGIVVQGNVLYHGDNPLGIDSYPFVPVFAYYEPQLPYLSLRCQGVVRGVRDVQAAYSHRKSIELAMLESRISSGYKYKENSLVDPDDIFLTGTGKGLAIKQEADLNDVQPIIPPEVPPSMLELSQSLASEIQEISGVTEELLGTSDEDRGVGLLSMLRQGAGLTTLQGLFDNLDRSQKLLGRIMIETIQSNFSYGKIERIIGEKAAPQFFNRDFGTFDCAIEDGLNTTTQKQTQFAQLVQLKQMGVPIPDQTLISSSTLQNKRELLEAISTEQQQIQEINNKKTQLEEMKTQAEIEDILARSQANRGLSLERSSRVEENRSLSVERLSQAEENRDIGLLNRIKSLKELENIDLEKIKKLIELANILKTQDSEEKMQEKMQVLQPNAEEIATITGDPSPLLNPTQQVNAALNAKKKSDLPLEKLNQQGVLNGRR